MDAELETLLDRCDAYTRALEIVPQLRCLDGHPRFGRYEYQLVPDAKTRAGMLWLLVRDVPLVDGWSDAATDVLCLVNQWRDHPSCFWTPHSLRLASGSIPRSTGIDVPSASETGISSPYPGLWRHWYWSPKEWSPNCDLVTYLNVVRHRFNHIP